MTNLAIVHRLLDLPLDQRNRTMFASAAGHLSFADVREGMLRFAAWLAGVEGIMPGDRVAICLPKSLDSILAVYGILAAGAAYVPVPFQGPLARQRAILDAVEARLLLTTEATAEQLRTEVGKTALPPTQIVEIDGSRGSIEALSRGTPPRGSVAEVSPGGLAAIYFTSGSTGEPKGVMWSHRSMDAATASHPQWAQMTERDRLISSAAMHYAASADIFNPLHCAGSMYLLSDRDAMFPDHITQIMEVQRTTIWSSSATALRLLVEDGNLAGRDLSALRRVEFYGERMPMPSLREAMAALPRAEFHGLYAASEAFDMVELSVPRPLPMNLSSLPLGRPSSTYRLTLRNDDGKEVESGAVGEICVVGPAATIGYWRDPELSAAKRLADQPDSYRTGDLAKLGKDGLLYLVGRKDHVVKLRGHRFDLGEIETTLKSHSAVRDAVAFSTAGKRGEGEVRAVVLADKSDALPALLHRFCRSRLPAFAQPTRIVVLEKFPLLSTGKIDRQTLEALTVDANRGQDLTRNNYRL